jgi:hypothetical protein
MMMQHRGGVEARERKHALCCKEMATQRKKSHEATEKEHALRHEEMTIQRKDSHAQHQMMTVMLMTMMQHNSALSGMMSGIGGIGAFSTGNPPQNDNNNAEQDNNTNTEPDDNNNLAN